MVFAYVKPARPDLRLVIPHRNWSPMPPEGARVPLDSYWLHRIADGDAVVTEGPAEPPEARAEEAAAPTKSPRKRPEV